MTGLGLRDARGAGLRRFAGYALAPNERGYCGPTDHAELRAYVADGRSDEGLAALVRRFDGPLPYLRVIADAAGLADPFDPAVVHAYWLGGDLLDAVDPGLCTDALLAAFDGAATVDPRRLHATRDVASPHHLFHVLVTYPWIDLVAAGRYQAVAQLDACRVRVGTVVGVDGAGARGVGARRVGARRARAADGAAVTVSSRPLLAGPEGLALGDPVTEVVRPLDRPDAPDLEPGDAVALHYDLLCDRLTSAEVAELQQRSVVTLAAVNRCLLGG